MLRFPRQFGGFMTRIVKLPTILASVSDPDRIRIQSGQWIRIRNPYPDPGGQK